MVHVHPVRNGPPSQDNRITPGSANATAAHSSLLAARLLFIFNNSSPSSALPPSCSSNLLFSSSTLCCCRRIRTLKIHAWFRWISRTFVFRPAQRSSAVSISCWAAICFLQQEVETKLKQAWSFYTKSSLTYLEKLNIPHHLLIEL